MGWLSGFLAQLNPRERMILVAGGLGGVALLLWALVIDPMFADVRNLKELTQRKQKAGVELAQLLAEYQGQSARIGNVTAAKSSAGFSLLSFLEGLSDRARVKGNIQYMRPTTSDVSEGVREHAVEIKVSNIRLDAMVNLLTAVEKAPHNLRVKRLNVRRRFADPNLLDVTFVVARYEAA